MCTSFRLIALAILLVSSAAAEEPKEIMFQLRDFWGRRVLCTQKITVEPGNEDLSPTQLLVNFTPDHKEKERTKFYTRGLVLRYQPASQSYAHLCHFSLLNCKIRVGELQDRDIVILQAETNIDAFAKDEFVDMGCEVTETK